MVRAKEYKKDVLCIEGQWVDDISSRSSIRGALILLEDNTQIKTYYHKCLTLNEAVTVAGKFSSHSECGLYYFAFHGASHSLHIEGCETSLDVLSEKLSGKLANKIVHFGCCETLKTDKRHLRRFLQKTGALAISGYTEQVAFFESTLLDILYFQVCQDWKDIRKIEDVMLSNYRILAKNLGFRLEYNH